MAISDINIDNPQDGEEVADGARQIRALKRDIKTSFPNFNSGSSIVDKNADELNDTPMKSATETITGQWTFTLAPFRAGSPFITASDVDYALLTANGLVGTGTTQVAQGSHTHNSSAITNFTTAVQALIAQWSNVSMHVGTGLTSFAVGNHQHDADAIGDLDEAVAGAVAASALIRALGRSTPVTFTNPTSASPATVTGYTQNFVGGGGLSDSATLGTITVGATGAGTFRITYSAVIGRLTGTDNIVVRIEAPLGSNSAAMASEFSAPPGGADTGTVSSSYFIALTSGDVVSLVTYALGAANTYTLDNITLTLEKIL